VDVIMTIPIASRALSVVRMWGNLIRLTFGRWRGQQKRLVDCVSELNGGRNIAAQMGDANGMARCATISGRQGNPYGEHTIHDPIVMTEGRNCLEIDNGSADGVANGDRLRIFHGARVGIFSHDGSYRYFEWEDATSSFGPMELSSN
jgi:hypothetical protein